MSFITPKRIALATMVTSLTIAVWVTLDKTNERDLMRVSVEKDKDRIRKHYRELQQQQAYSSIPSPLLSPHQVEQQLQHQQLQPQSQPQSQQ